MTAYPTAARLLPLTQKALKPGLSTSARREVIREIGAQAARALSCILIAKRGRMHSKFKRDLRIATNQVSTALRQR